MEISKTFQGDLTFIFDVLSEPSLGFVSYSVLQAVEMVVSFTEKSFYRKQGSVTVRVSALCVLAWRMIIVRHRIKFSKNI